MNLCRRIRRTKYSLQQLQFCLFIRINKLRFIRKLQIFIDQRVYKFIEQLLYTSLFIYLRLRKDVKRFNLMPDLVHLSKYPEIISEILYKILIQSLRKVIFFHFIVMKFRIHLR